MFSMGSSPQGLVRRDLEKIVRVMAVITRHVPALFLHEVKLAANMQLLHGASAACIGWLPARDRETRTDTVPLVG